MSRFRFGLAEQRDEPELRSFLRDCIMPGKLELTFQKEPDYFNPAGSFGPFHQTVVCRDSEAGEVVGIGCRSVREVHSHGRPGPMGYLSMLRSAERVRSGMLLARGYKFLRELHQDGRAPSYLTTIADGNDLALSVLTSGKGGLPSYEPLGSYSTFAIATGRQIAEESAVEHPSVTDLAAFLGSHGKSRQFFPVYDESDFAGSGSTFQELDSADVFAYRSDGQLRGVMGLWDQRAFKQTVVAGYQGLLGQLRILYNVAARVSGRQMLPPPGSQLNYGFLAFPAVQDDDPLVFRSLLQAVRGRAREKGLDFVLFGCHESDPLRNIVQPLAFLTYGTQVFQVRWDTEPDASNADLSVGPPLPLYLELGCL